MRRYRVEGDEVKLMNYRAAGGGDFCVIGDGMRIYLDAKDELDAWLQVRRWREQRKNKGST